MSVIMTLRVNGDPKQFERYAQENPEEMQGLVERAKSRGLIAHRFYGSEGEVLVVDEWPDAESFQQFFDESQPEIGPMMQAAGVTSEPEITFWHKLDTKDEVGWNA
jgi:heme-degrading monooxygenase HmoA